MKILTLLGGPHDDGNTERLLDWAERAWRAAGHTVDRINLSTRRIQPCTACLACAESENEPGCVLADDGPEIFRALAAAEGIVYAVPLYMWGFPSTMKALIDRSVCLVRAYGRPEHRSFVEGVPSALLVSCAGPAEGNADLIEEMYRRYAEFARLDDRGAYVFPHCTDVNMLPNTHGALARELARALVSRTGD